MVHVLHVCLWPSFIIFRFVQVLYVQIYSGFVGGEKIIFPVFSLFKINKIAETWREPSPLSAAMIFDGF